MNDLLKKLIVKSASMYHVNLITELMLLSKCQMNDII